MAEMARKNYSLSGYNYARYAEKRVLSFSSSKKSLLTPSVYHFRPNGKNEKTIFIHSGRIRHPITFEYG
jgi:hypothetical protein